jgi:hypothetical protein
MPLREQFTALVSIGDVPPEAPHLGPCWIWEGPRTTKGYGRICIAGKDTQAHRLAYELFVGPIPVGLTIDHLCRVHECVNPRHLEAVTNRENLLRGHGACAEHARKTHCPRGHAYDEANTYHWRGHRKCRICENARTAVRNKRRREQKSLRSL